MRDVSSNDRVATVFGAMCLVAADAMREATEQAAGLSDAAPAALSCLLPVPAGRSIDELRRVVGLTPSGGVRLVDRMAEAQLVERRAGTDRRSVMVVLTARGRRVARAVLTARNEALERLLAPLSPADRTVLDALTARIIEGNVVERLARRAHGDQPRGGWMCRLCDQQRCGRDDGNCPSAEAVH